MLLLTDGHVPEQTGIARELVGAPKLRDRTAGVAIIEQEACCVVSVEGLAAQRLGQRGRSSALASERPGGTRQRQEQSQGQRDATVHFTPSAFAADLRAAPVSASASARVAVALRRARVLAREQLP